jgi:hypothetical protein
MAALRKWLLGAARHRAGGHHGGGAQVDHRHPRPDAADPAARLAPGPADRLSHPRFRGAAHAGILLVVGGVASNFVGKKLVRLGDAIVTRIPVVRSIYSSVKQVSDTLFSESGNAFRTAVLIQWPRPDVWTIGFVTGAPGRRRGQLPARRRVRQRVRADHAQPHGRLLRDAAQGRLHRTPKMSVDEALKYVVSMGVVSPRISN